MDGSAGTLCQQMAISLVQQQEFSAATLGKAKFCLLDFLSCVHSTMHFPWVQQALAVARTNSSFETGGAQVFGTPYRVSVQDAAFVNAIAGHSLVRDDMHVGSVSHLGVVVIPAALALAESKQVDGRTLLEAIVCGYEAGGKLGSMLMDVETAKKIYRELIDYNIDVLLDDRDERAGVKFNDADLLGIPIRVTVGLRGVKDGQVEVRLRPESESIVISVKDATAFIRNKIKELYDSLK